MQRVALVLFIAFELCYYLLIAQTGIIEHFSSNIYQIAPLPIGGVIGSILSFFVKTKNSNKISIFLTIQLIMSFFYPNLTQPMLFILGIGVGALAPLMINELKKATSIELGTSLAISYVVGTSLFNYDASSRGNLAICITLVVFICSRSLPTKIESNSVLENYSLLTMILWIFLDSALFEALSRDTVISIWRGGFSVEIAMFHIIGVIAALTVKIEKNQKEIFIIILFALSYLLYFIQEPLALSIIYPFIISYYNVVILQTVLKKDLKTIGIYMIFIGWFASGLGLFVALENLIIFVPIVFLIALFGVLNIQYTQNKEIQYV